jgi:hypothetical protein
MEWGRAGQSLPTVWARFHLAWMQGPLHEQNTAPHFLPRLLARELRWRRFVYSTDRPAPDHPTADHPPPPMLTRLLCRKLPYSTWMGRF